MHGESWSQECVLHILIDGWNPKKKEVEEEMADPMPPLCLFCLEELKESDVCPNVVGCGCELHTHPQCLQAWFQQKQEVECPICHTVSIPNPVRSAQQQQQQEREIVIIHVQDPVQARHLQMREQCMATCCCMLLFWWVGGIILQYA